MDSNRRFLEIESGFPGREVHTGVNDLESDSHDSNSIPKSLIEAAKIASRRFPNAKVFISEITPRKDEYNLKRHRS